MTALQAEEAASIGEPVRPPSQSDGRDRLNSIGSPIFSSDEWLDVPGLDYNEEPEGDTADTQSEDNNLPSYAQTLSNPTPLYVVDDPDASDGPSMPLRAGRYNVREFKVFDKFPFNLIIRATDAEATTYFIRTSISPRKPDLTIHSSDSKAGPVLGMAHFHFFNSDNAFCINNGDDAASPATMCEKLTRTSKWTHANYGFELSVGGGHRARFCWSRTKYRPFYDQNDIKLVDVERPDVILAEYRATCRDVYKRGRILIRRGLGQKWEVTVVLTAMMVVELARRRSRKRMNEELRGLIYW